MGLRRSRPRADIEAARLTEEGEDRRHREIRRFTRLEVLLAALTLVMLTVGTVFAVMQFTREARGAELAIGKLSLVGVPIETALAEAGQTVEIGEQYADKIDLTLNNRGETSALVTGLELTYESTALEVCDPIGGGPLEYKATYDLPLPGWTKSDAQTMTGVTRDDTLVFEVEAGRLERLSVTVGPPEWPQAAYPRAYTARLRILHDGAALESEEIHFLSPPAAMRYLLDATYLGRDADNEVSKCVERNAALIEDMAAADGVHSLATECYPGVLRDALESEPFEDKCRAELSMAAESDASQTPSPTTSPPSADSDWQLVDRVAEATQASDGYVASLRLPQLVGGDAQIAAAWSSIIDEFVAEKRSWIFSATPCATGCPIPDTLDMLWQGEVLGRRFASATITTTYQPPDANGPIGQIDSLVLDLTTGEQLTLDDIVQNAAAAMLEPVNAGLADGVSMVAAPTERCEATPLSDPAELRAWTVGPEGITFWFGQYVVAAGVCESTFETVPWSSIEPLLTDLGLDALSAA